MNQIKQNEELAKSFSELNTAAITKIIKPGQWQGKFLIFHIKADAYGTQSAKYHCIIHGSTNLFEALSWKFILSKSWKHKNENIYPKKIPQPIGHYISQ